jgi:hypothetical protein
MAQGFEFKVEGLEELQRDLENAVKKCPAQAQETLKQLSKEFKASAKKKADAELRHVKRVGDEQKKAIRAKWGTKIVDDYLTATALIWNSAKHFHLVENGHELVKDGKAIGFVPGKHIMEKTRNEYKDIVPERFERMIEEILKEGDLN